MKKTPTELTHFERSVFLKEVIIQNLWNSEMGSQKIMNVPIGNIIEFQQRDRQDAQNLNIDTFCRLPVSSAHCIIGTEKYPVAGYYYFMRMIIILKAMFNLKKVLEL